MTDARLFEVSQIDFLIATPSKLFRTRIGDIPHVSGAFAQIIIFNRRQRRGVALGDLVKCVFRVDLFFLDRAA